MTVDRPQSPLEGDEPRFETVGSWRDVDSALASLLVSERPLEEQRAAIAWALRQPGTRALLEPLADELSSRGLL